MLYWSGKFIRVHSLPEIWLWNEDMAHGQHTKSSQLFWSVKYNRREPTRHLGIQPDLDTCLDLEDKNNSIWRTTFKKTSFTLTFPLVSTQSKYDIVWTIVFHSVNLSMWEIKRFTTVTEYLVFAFHQQIQQLLSVDNWLPVICHQTNQSRVPFVHNFGKRSWTRCH